MKCYFIKSSTSRSAIETARLLRSSCLSKKKLKRGERHSEAVLQIGLSWLRRPMSSESAEEHVRCFDRLLSGFALQELIEPRLPVAST